MLPYNTQPSLVIANTAEAFLPFITTAPSNKEALIAAEHALSDRALLWGGPNKCVVTPFPVPHSPTLARQLGYVQLINLSPPSPSFCLCEDIATHSHLLHAVTTFLSQAPTVSIISYCSSPFLNTLIDVLRRSTTSTLLLPETSDNRGIQAALRFDSKSGFRSLVLQWSAECPFLRPPEAHIAFDTITAARHALSFLEKGTPCIIKPDAGDSGLGQLWLNTTNIQSTDLSAIHKLIASDPHRSTMPLVVEEMITPPPALPRWLCSPSIEAHISPDGTCSITYIALQLFSSRGNFSGIIIPPSESPLPFDAALRAHASYIGSALSREGYVGYFDLDFVIDSSGYPRIIEGNPRRTGGTHVHDLATHLFGPAYRHTHCFQSWDNVSLPRCFPDISDFLRLCSPFLFPIRSTNTGIVPSISSTAANGRIGYVVIARSLNEATALNASFVRHLSTL
ncbi:hypothetical protein Thimo_3709 (plasmid) [Thioflavicoccus mobilis 8321]|uniref:ATP-grasp domain-containing protein n=1 Tax=Thioflavicoccus mobilis 8321 TaxID=765912 RepID=L0H017_9GAMM|nr:hypothetical protein Thimo_3709 [Thioflavicoccus mobilis 8321]